MKVVSSKPLPSSPTVGNAPENQDEQGDTSPTRRESTTPTEDDNPNGLDETQDTAAAPTSTAAPTADDDPSNPKVQGDSAKKEEKTDGAATNQVIEQAPAIENGPPGVFDKPAWRIVCAVAVFFVLLFVVDMVFGVISSSFSKGVSMTHHKVTTLTGSFYQAVSDMASKGASAVYYTVMGFGVCAILALVGFGCYVVRPYMPAFKPKPRKTALFVVEFLDKNLADFQEGFGRIAVPANDPEWKTKLTEHVVDFFDHVLVKSGVHNHTRGYEKAALRFDFYLPGEGENYLPGYGKKWQPVWEGDVASQGKVAEDSINLGAVLAGPAWIAFNICLAAKPKTATKDVAPEATNDSPSSPHLEDNYDFNDSPLDPGVWRPNADGYAPAQSQVQG